MRTTISVEYDLLRLAARFSGTTNRSNLVEAGLAALIEKKSREQLAFRASRRRR